MWLVRGGLEHPVHSYNFRWTRSGKNVIPFLEGFNGNVIQSDGYAGYDAAVNLWNENHPEHKIELCNCNIHARRKFADSVKATKSKTAEQAVRLYSKIFHEEKELREKYQKNLITEERYLELRKENVLPLFESFHEWLLEKSEREQILGSSKTADAIKYTLGRWDKLIKFLNYSFVSPDTNAAERAVKPFVMARKNFLFSGSGKGAECSCFLFSLIETAKLKLASRRGFSILNGFVFSIKLSKYIFLRKIPLYIYLKNFANFGNFSQIFLKNSRTWMCEQRKERIFGTKILVRI